MLVEAYYFNKPLFVSCWVWVNEISKGIHIGDCKAFYHDDIIKWRYLPRYWPFVRGIHRSPVNSSHKGQWRGALMLSLICASNKRLSEQSWGWWFETPWRSLWRHCSDYPIADTGVLLYASWMPTVNLFFFFFWCLYFILINLIDASNTVISNFMYYSTGMLIAIAHSWNLRPSWLFGIWYYRPW